MKNLNKKNAKEFAEEKFKQMGELLSQWNSLHSECMIKAIKDLTKDEKIINTLIPLAWIHDIGKIRQEDNHAEISIQILEENGFTLTEIEKDCILNHGASKKPESEEAKIFQKSDGLSLFYPKIITFRFWAEAKEGLSFEQIKQRMEKLYKKYSEAYKDDKKACEILYSKYSSIK